MKTLLVDLNIKLDGHKYGFMQQLMHYTDADLQHSYVYLSNAGLHFQEGRNQYQTLTDEEGQKIKLKSGLKKYIAEWRIIQSYAAKAGVDKIVLLDFDNYQIPMGLIWGKIPISGIWFRPYKRIKSNGRGKISYRLLLMRKRIQIGVALVNPFLKKVFILNDEKMPAWHDARKFFYLPDPYFHYLPDPNFQVREHYGINPDAIVLLQFGFMDGRKNNERIMAALRSVKAAVPICLLIVGKFEEGYQSKLEALGSNSNFKLIMDDRFVTDGEMVAIFAASDIVLRMNVDFYGSSGVVGIAAAHNKVCLGSDEGLMAEVMEKYGLGVLAPVNDVTEIASKIQLLIDEPSRRTINGQKYLQDHSAEKFASTLLG